MQETPRISIILATHNRRKVILSTLQRLSEMRIGDACKILVVDNASTDGTAEAIASDCPSVELLRLTENQGSCAKAFGADRTNSEFILFLDDDSFPPQR